MKGRKGKLVKMILRIKWFIRRRKKKKKVTIWCKARLVSLWVNMILKRKVCAEMYAGITFLKTQNRRTFEKAADTSTRMSQRRRLLRVRVKHAVSVQATVHRSTLKDKMVSFTEEALLSKRRSLQWTTSHFHCILQPATVLPNRAF